MLQLQITLLSVCELQCTNGHLMCASCLSHLFADARLKDETPTCPGCRCEISRTLCNRNLAVEKAISELPAPCQFCARLLPRSSLPKHEKEMCQDRFVGRHTTPILFAAVTSVVMVWIRCAVHAVLTMSGHRTSPVPMSLQSVRCVRRCCSRCSSSPHRLCPFVNIQKFWHRSPRLRDHRLPHGRDGHQCSTIHRGLFAVFASVFVSVFAVQKKRRCKW